LLAKNACSPLEKTNSSEQSRQVSDRSWYTLSRTSCGARRCHVPAPVTRTRDRPRRQEGGRAIGLGRARTRNSCRAEYARRQGSMPPNHDVFGVEGPNLVACLRLRRCACAPTDQASAIRRNRSGRICVGLPCRR
jgi:hypothetical protein